MKGAENKPILDWSQIRNTHPWYSKITEFSPVKKEKQSLCDYLRDMFMYVGAGPEHFEFPSQEGFTNTQIRQAIVDAIYNIPLDENVTLAYHIICECCNYTDSHCVEFIGYNIWGSNLKTVGDVLLRSGDRSETSDGVIYAAVPDSVLVEFREVKFSPAYQFPHARTCPRSWRGQFFQENRNDTLPPDSTYINVRYYR